MRSGSESRLDEVGEPSSSPLSQALREYAGVANRDKLLSLLPVQRVAEHCGWLKAMVDAGEIFHPLRWSSGEATQFLSSVPDLETAGVVVRITCNLARQSTDATAGHGGSRYEGSIHRGARWAARFSPGGNAGGRAA